ncbi:CbrC family protein [Acinetobacter nematophilus]|uniref:CbrC family protein n=1 Tax=Acinetobacter nematophilus TaxID=2994642 RepID=A0A9X3IGQ1_9GAMM|nr:CbrC family protein [Acinetobacter nematophilus]MCX5467331.1 CbrC family protein [Acinetobacter nematophilus]
MDYPQFKYHPNAYRLDLFENQIGRCSICNQQHDLKYIGCFYSVDEPDYICP